jgi:protein-disulfide isomerase
MAKKKKPIAHGNAAMEASAAKSPKSAPASRVALGKRPDYRFLSLMGAVLLLGFAMLYLSFSSGNGQAGAILPSQAGKQAQSPPRAAAPQEKVSASAFDSAHFQGNASADIVLVEYGDFECQFCASALAPISELVASHPEIKFAYRHYPLSAHPGAEKAAEAAECAGEQGKFWEMHGKLFASQDALSAPSLKSYAEGLSLDDGLFSSCLDSGKMSGVVSAQAAEGQSLGVRATPTFLVFSRKGDGNAALAASVGKEAQTLFSRYSDYNLPVSAVEVRGAGVGLLFAGALPYSDFEEVLGAFNQ